MTEEMPTVLHQFVRCGNAIKYLHQHWYQIETCVPVIWPTLSGPWPASVAALMWWTWEALMGRRNGYCNTVAAWLVQWNSWGVIQSELQSRLNNKLIMKLDARIQLIAKRVRKWTYILMLQLWGRTNAPQGPLRMGHCNWFDSCLQSRRKSLACLHWQKQCSYTGTVNDVLDFSTDGLIWHGREKTLKDNSKTWNQSNFCNGHVMCIRERTQCSILL